jgi:uncharacterized membrane protein YgaE (UPF0421/DUF939 family)
LIRWDHVVVTLALVIGGMIVGSMIAVSWGVPRWPGTLLGAILMPTYLTFDR